MVIVIAEVAESIALGDKRANSVKDLLILYGVNKNNV